MYLIDLCCVFQLLDQVEQENLGARSEISEYEDLIQWLDAADQMLQIVEQPLYDREGEFLVSCPTV